VQLKPTGVEDRIPLRSKHPFFYIKPFFPVADSSLTTEFTLPRNMKGPPSLFLFCSQRPKNSSRLGGVLEQISGYGLPLKLSTTMIMFFCSALRRQRYATEDCELFFFLSPVHISLFPTRENLFLSSAPSLFSDLFPPF